MISGDFLRRYQTVLIRAQLRSAISFFMMNYAVDDGRSGNVAKLGELRPVAASLFFEYHASFRR